MSQNNRRRQKI